MAFFGLCGIPWVYLNLMGNLVLVLVVVQFSNSQLSALCPDTGEEIPLVSSGILPGLQTEPYRQDRRADFISIYPVPVLSHPILFQSNLIHNHFIFSLLGFPLLAKLYMWPYSRTVNNDRLHTSGVQCMSSLGSRPQVVQPYTQTCLSRYRWNASFVFCLYRSVRALARLPAPFVSGSERVW